MAARAGLPRGPGGRKSCRNGRPGGPGAPHTPGPADLVCRPWHRGPENYKEITMYRTLKGGAWTCAAQRGQRPCPSKPNQHTVEQTMCVYVQQPPPPPPAKGCDPQPSCGRGPVPTKNVQVALWRRGDPHIGTSTQPRHLSCRRLPAVLYTSYIVTSRVHISSPTSGKALKGPKAKQKRCSLAWWAGGGGAPAVQGTRPTQPAPPR